MPGRFGPRFALEAVFLIALAIAMGLADLSARAIVAVMAVAWVLVALVEWLASREAAARPDEWSNAAYGRREPEREHVTEIVSPAPPAAEEADTGDPLIGADAATSRRRWFRRRPRTEETPVER